MRIVNTPSSVKSKTAEIRASIIKRRLRRIYAVLLLACELGFTLRHSQRLCHSLDIPHYEGIERIKGKSYAVVGYAPLGEIVGADALASVAAPDQAFAVFVICGLVLRIIIVVKP